MYTLPGPNVPVQETVQDRRDHQKPAGARGGLPRRGSQNNPGKPGQTRARHPPASRSSGKRQSHARGGSPECALGAGPVVQFMNYFTTIYINRISPSGRRGGGCRRYRARFGTTARGGVLPPLLRHHPPAGIAGTAPVRGVLLAEVREQELPPAGLRLAVGRHCREFCRRDPRVPGLAPAGGDQAPDLFPVAGAVEEDALRGEAVAAGPTGLLVIGLDALWQVVVDHVPGIGLVDPHAERDSGADDPGFAGPEGLLHRIPLGAREAGMVGPGSKALFAEGGGALLGAVPAQAVHDPGFLPVLCGIPQEHRRRVPLLHHPVGEVSAVETAGELPGPHQAELLPDVGPGLRDRRGGEGHDRDLRELLFYERQPAVLGPEVVPPLRDAVGLVDGHEPEIALLQESEEPGLEALLGRDIEDPEAAVPHGGGDRLLLAGTKAARTGRGRDAPAVTVVCLVLHQGNERRDNDRQAAAVQGRQLVAEGLAPAGREDRKRVAATGNGADDRSLAGEEPVIAPVLLQQVPQCRHRISCCRGRPGCI